METRVKQKHWTLMSKEELRAEYLKCQNDPIYFTKTYIKVEHQLLGLVNFDLFPFQETIFNDLKAHRFNLLRKFRQAGATTIGCAYSLHIAIFQKNKTIAILSIGDRESMEVLARIKIMYEELPPFLRPKIAKGGHNKHVLHLSTGSKIKARPAQKTSGRSLAGYFLMIDEAAFIENIGDIWAAVYPIISTGGRVFVLSTVNGMGNWYHNLYEEGIKGQNSFHVIDIKWQEHPQYYYNPDYEWLYADLKEKDPTFDITNFEEVTKKNIGIKRWRQEYLAEFLGTGNTYLDGETLQLLYETVDKNYDIKYNNRMRVWKDPDPYHDYVIGADCSLGRGLDYSAFIILDAYNGEQVAEFYSNKTPIDEFAQIIANEGRLYNLATVMPERNTIGNNLIHCLFAIEEYENIWTDEKGDMGYQVTTSNREILLADMEEAIRNKKVKINSERAVKELLTFIINDNGKPEADELQNDDLVTALKLAIKGLNDVLVRSPTIISKLVPQNKEPLGILGDGNTVSNKYWKNIPMEDVKWILGR